jgi:hypothetical protein
VSTTTISEKNNGLDLLVGTQKGCIHLLSVNISTDILEKKRYEVVRYDTLLVDDDDSSDVFRGASERPPIINAFCRVCTEDFNSPKAKIANVPPAAFAVGHSHGFGLVVVTPEKQST